MQQMPVDPEASAAEGPSPIPAQLSADNRRLARCCLAVLAVLATGGMLGVAFSLYLAVHHPLILVTLSPIGRHLILVAPSVDPIAFVAVGASRRMVFSATCFFLGRALGASALGWLELHVPRVSRFYRWLERLFTRAPRTAVLLLAGPGLSIIAGSTGMRPPVFLPLLAVGLVLRMLLLLALAESLREPIEQLMALIREHWVPGTVVLVTALGLSRWMRRGRHTPLRPPSL